MKDSRQVVILNLDDILPNRFQPRIKFDEKAIVELSESIKEHGVIQPIIVRKIDDKFEIIAGERRYKASVMAGKTTIPAIVVDLNDKESSEIALIENVQRKDLTPIEEAISYRKIFDMGNITQEELATKLGVSQSTIANKMRLLNLDDEVQDALLDEKISERHARSLLRLSKMSEQREMLKRIITERLTVRRTDEEIEKIIKGNNNMDIMDSFNNKVEEPIQNNNQSNTNPFDISSTVNNQVISNTTNENYSSNVNNIEVFDFADFSGVSQINNQNMPQMPIIEDNISESNNFNVNDNSFMMNNSNDTNIVNNQEFSIPQSPIIEDNNSNINEQVSYSNPFISTNIEEVQNNNFESENIIQTAPIVEDNEFKAIVNDEDKNQVLEETQVNNIVENYSAFDNEQTESNDVNEEPEIKQGRFFNILSQDNEEDNNQDNNESLFNGFNQMNTETNIPSYNSTEEQPALNSNEQSMNNNIFNSFDNLNSNINQVNNQMSEINQQISDNDGLMNNSFDYNSTPIVPSYNDTINNNYDYSEPVQQQEQVVAEPTLKDIIAMVRNCADDIEKQGFELDSEEFDFQDIYQVIFKIKKK